MATFTQDEVVRTFKDLTSSLVYLRSSQMPINQSLRMPMCHVDKADTHALFDIKLWIETKGPTGTFSFGTGTAVSESHRNHSSGPS